MMTTTVGEYELIEIIEGLTPEELDICVTAGWVAPAIEAGGARRYQAIDVARVRLIHELRIDLAIGDEAVPVVLSLLDQIYALRHRLDCIGESLNEQPDSVRTQIRLTLERKLAKD